MQSGFKDLHIAVSGLIGAGKTTLSTELGKVLELPVYYEPVVDNKYLADFYKNPKKHSFALQVYLLNKRFRQQQQIIWSEKGGIQDRSIYEDGVFAEMLFNSGLMDERDYNTYKELFANMSNFMKRPNLIVHLDVSPIQSFERTKKRDRKCENGLTLDYLILLHKHYESFLSKISRVIPVIRVDWEEFQTAEAMAKAIKKEYTKMQNIRFVSFSETGDNVSFSETEDNVSFSETEGNTRDLV